jgi:hypothetical protein
MEIITRHEEHARVLGIGVATFRRRLGELLARGYPARRIGGLLIGDREGVIAWLRQGEPSSTPTPTPTPPPPARDADGQPIKRGRGRPRKYPLRVDVEGV